jgi:PAS domain S-box-containing protein
METDKRHLEAVLEALPVGVVITDAEGGILLTNSMDEQIWGSRPVTHDVGDYVQYRAWWADSGKLVEPHEWASAQAVQKGESVFGQMLEIQRFDGGRRFILNSAVPIRDEEGRVTGSAVAVQDITELRRAEQALRESEEKYRLLFQNMAEGFALYELLYDEQGKPEDWRVLEVNDAYTRHTGMARDRIAGRRISELFPAAIPEYLPRFARVVETQTPTSFETYAKAVGRYQHVETFPAGEHRFASIIEDISERKRSEAELQRQATILSQLNDAIIVMDKDWQITYWNAGAERVYGYRAGEVLGRTPDCFPEPKYVGTTREELARHLSQHGEASVESLRLTKDGRQVWIESRAMMIRGSADAPGGSIWVDRDITARKEAEEALQRMEEELTLSAQERAALDERQRLARELHDSVSQALYGISLGAHTALTVLDTDREKAREALSFTLSLVSTGLTEMRALIFELRPEALETDGLVAALNRKSAELRARHDIEIALELHDEPSLPLAAKEALYRIAQEAMQNAVKHARCDRLDVRLDCEPDGCCLEVCDNGIGFDPHAAYPGHLGLRSMRERAANVGGTLDISSLPDSGTQIRAFVPGPARTSSSR